MGAESLIGAGISAGTSIFKGIMGGDAARQEADAKARNYMVQALIATYNKSIAEQNAQWAMEFGEYKAGQTALAGRAKLGALKAQEGAKGVDVNSGSLDLVNQNVARAAQQDVATVRSDASRQWYGYEIQAWNFQNQYMADMSGAQEAEAAGATAANASLLEGLSGAVGAFGKVNYSGLFS